MVTLIREGFEKHLVDFARWTDCERWATPPRWEDGEVQFNTTCRLRQRNLDAGSKYNAPIIIIIKPVANKLLGYNDASYSRAYILPPEFVPLAPFLLGGSNPNPTSPYSSAPQR